MERTKYIKRKKRDKNKYGEADRDKDAHTHSERQDTEKAENKYFRETDKA